jgi:DNA-binding CsgD family transcriptional regulator
MSATQKQIARVLDAVKNLYSLRDMREFPEQVMTSCSGLIPALYHSWMAVDKGALTEVAQLEQSHTDPEEVHHAMKELAHQHPCYKQAMELKDGDVVMALSDFTSFRMWKQTAFYNFVHKANGIKDQLIGGYRGPEGIFGLMLGRDKAFSAEERFLMELIQPHLVVSYKNAKMLTAAQKHSATLPDSIIPISSDGRVSDWPSSVLNALREHSHAPVLTYRVPVPEDFELWLHRTLQDLRRAAGSSTPLTPYVAQSQDSRLIARLIPAVQSQPARLVFEVTAEDRDFSRLSKLGLTPKECEVAGWIAQGKANEEIGIILKSATNTVRKHVEHIFAKLGVENRTTLAKRVFEEISKS